MKHPRFKIVARNVTPDIEPIQKEETPTVFEMVKNVGKSIVTNTKSVITGNGLKLTKEEADKRLTICKGCAHFDAATERCRKCGCYTSLKTYLKAERCPIGMW